MFPQRLRPDVYNCCSDGPLSRFLIENMQWRTRLLRINEDQSDYQTNCGWGRRDQSAFRTVPRLLPYWPTFCNHERFINCPIMQQQRHRVVNSLMCICIHLYISTHAHTHTHTHTHTHNIYLSIINLNDRPYLPLSCWAICLSLNTRNIKYF